MKSLNLIKLCMPGEVYRPHNFRSSLWKVLFIREDFAMVHVNHIRVASYIRKNYLYENCDLVRYEDITSENIRIKDEFMSKFIGIVESHSNDLRFSDDELTELFD